MDKKLGLVRVAAVSPVVKPADTVSNLNNILTCLKRADKDGAGICVLPELALSGASAGDLFTQNHLYDSQLEALKSLAEKTSDMTAVICCGFYLRYENALYNSAALIQGGKILGIVPKMSESPHFADGYTAAKDTDCVRLFGETVPFGDIVFEDEASGLNISIVMGDDLDNPSRMLPLPSMNGAQVILVPGFGNEYVGAAATRREIVRSASRRTPSAIVASLSGTGESTADAVSGGHCLIAECGDLLSETSRFNLDNQILYCEIDYERIDKERVSRKASDTPNTSKKVPLSPLRTITAGDKLYRRYEKTPFVPRNLAKRKEHCREIFDIQSTALARRLIHVGAKKSIVGISGGLDSTLSLLVAVKAHEICGMSASDILAVTMPGFGTTEQTHGNAARLIEQIGAEMLEIPITESVRQHFRDIGHEETDRDVTYENAQARERTQILMDLANQTNGLVVGTGDLSEEALGWCTFNGDQMSMYNVNCGVPKTLIPSIISLVAEERSDDVLAGILADIADTPISPELLPPDESGNMAQKTEDSVGPYELHDFFIYHTLHTGATPSKLLFLAKSAFAGEYDEDTVKKYLKVFYRRFFSQQFKRNASPDGPRIGSVSLSPLNGFSIPSDASPRIWLDEISD